ncbi:MAG: sigma 54-interacting transcriptional regulator [Bradymonadales bacterium]|nr:sigma 54-interacting transcriptional regulator [Bradymonadales bacterium]
MDLVELLSRYNNLEMVLDSLTDAVIAHDKERRITFINRAAERLSGRSREEVLGQDCHQVFDGGFCGSHCSFCHGSEQECKLQKYPLVMADLDGDYHQLEATVVPITDNRGEVVGAVLAAKDITEISQLRRSLERERSFQGIIGQHHRMQSVYELIRQVAPTDIAVLVQGESGTGKELVAWAIHNESARAGNPFVVVNCGAIPEGLLESELFGHVRGAFTGAVRDKRGRFELADGGTLFLDEVAELSPTMQVKLLRVLQDKRIERVGAETHREVNVRIISATNQNLRERVEAKEFREDLFFRLCVVPIHLPPLRDRQTDILLLADHFLSEFAGETRRSVPGLSEGAVKCLLEYRWPGNVRELINALQYAMIRTRGAIIQADDLPVELRRVHAEAPLRRAGRKQKLNWDDVQMAMKTSGGNKAEAARLLGVGRATLYRFLDAQESG